jgi:hypothetical protein
MIPKDLSTHKPEIVPLVPIGGAELAWPDNDPGDPGAGTLPRTASDGPACCPVGFCHKASAILDLILVAQAVVSALKAAIEEEALP